MTEQRKVVVTYTYGADAEENGAGTIFVEQVAARLPLRNLSWQSPIGSGGGNNNTVRTIPVLEVELKRYSPDMFPRAMPGTIYHSPYFLHMYLVTIDVSSCGWEYPRQGSSGQRWYPALECLMNFREQEHLDGLRHIGYVETCF